MTLTAIVIIVSSPIGPSITSAQDETAPNQPTGFAAEAGDTQVKLSWDDPDDQTSITGYQYQQKTGGDFGDVWTDITGSGAETTSHIVRRLTNGTEHTFRVRAVNAAGESDASEVAATPEAASNAPARPRNFSAAQTGVRQVELTWDPHLYPLTVTGYQYIQDDGSGPNWTDIPDSDSSTDSYIVAGQAEGVTYTFQVRAVNGDGSTKSDSRSVMIIEAPAAPDSFSAIAGDEQVWLGWRSPADFTISEYEYQQKEGDGDFGDWIDIPGSRSGTTFHIVTGLTNDTSYAFRTRAVNAAGASVESSTSTAIPATASSAPDEPKGFAARQIGVHQVELTWEASSNPLNVTDYQFKQKNGSWTTISRSDSHTVSGLNEETTYTFVVRAVNDFGNGNSSGTKSVTVVAKPAAPTGLAAETGDTQVRLTWNDPSNASITKYQVLQLAESIRLISDDRDDVDELGWSVAVDGDTLVIGALGDDPNNTGAAYVFTRDAEGWAQVGKLTAEVRGNDAGFGHGVAVHGDTIVVGAYQDNTEGSDAGAAFVFTRPATGWVDMTQTAKFIASDTAADDEFGSSVAVYGDTIVVGAPEEDSLARGSAYIFTKPANGWVNSEETAKLRGQLAGDRFGRSVAVYGDTVVVGANENDNNKGAAYVFIKSATTGVWDSWDETNAHNATAKLTASGAAANDKLGWSVAVDGDTIVVGAPYYDSPSNFGSAYVFTRPATGWVDMTQTAKLIASDAAAGDEFGISVAVDGDTVVVGADGDDSSRGSAYVFTKPNGDGSIDWKDWGSLDDEGKAELTAKFTAFGAAADDKFGISVAADGGIIVVGAVGDDDDKGSAYVFSTEWTDIPGSGVGTTSHIATRLPNNFEHTFQVRAVNAAGESDATDPIAATPVAATAVPATPDIFSAEQTGVGQVRLAWTASTKPLTVSRYLFTQNAGDTDNVKWTNIDGSDSSTASHTVTGLTAGTDYDFAVSADNDAGSTETGIQSVTLVALPQVPGGFDADEGDERVRLSWDDPDASTIDKYQLLQLDPSKLAAADGLRGDLYGYSVAVDGDTIVVGAHLHEVDDNGTSIPNAGAAYVFTKVSGVWAQVAKLTASDGAANDEFGYSVAVDGDTIVVGAHLHDVDDNGTSISNAGAVYVFVEPTDGWDSDADGIITETAKLTAFGAATDDEFGISVAVDGDTILVGAHQDDDNGDQSGSAYIFTKFGGLWGNAPDSGEHRVETAKLTASDAAASDEFGIAVAVDGDTAVIGARQDDTRNGSAYVFTKVSGVWSQKAKLIASDGAANDEFGSSVAVNDDEDTIVVGAHLHDATIGSNTATDSGAAYVFMKPSSGWADGTETAKLFASDAAAYDEFGISVAVDGDEDTVVVGAYLDDDNGNNSGSAYVFTQDSNGWSQKTKLTGPSRGKGDWLGHSVAVVGNTVIAGADKSSSSGPDSGAVYLWVVPQWADISGSGPTTTSHIVTGLTNGEEYRFQIRAVDKVQGAGAGSPSYPRRATPQKPKPAKPTGISPVAGDKQVKLSWDSPADVTRPVTNYQLWQHAENAVLTTVLTDDPPEANDEFGYAVAVDGDTAVVGMPGGDDGGLNAGAAFVFIKGSGGWTEVAKLRASDPNAAYRFGLSVALQGSTIVVGAPDHASKKGAVYLFTKSESDGEWGKTPDLGTHRIETAKFLAEERADDDEFGYSVAVDGDTVVVGAHLENANDDDIDLNNDVADSGAVYVFDEPSGDWANDEDGDGDGTNDHTTETLKLSGSGLEDHFGKSVAIDGDTVVVGASGQNSSQGSVFVFIKPATGWANSSGDEAAKLTAYSRNNDARFGRSVAIDDDTIVVGASTDDGNRGSAFVFIEPATGWANSPGTETAQLNAYVRSANDYFGESVAVDGDTVVIGANALNDTRPGTAYAFTKPKSGGWADNTEAAKLTGSGTTNGDRYGNSVAVEGLTVMVGSNGQDINGVNGAGAANVYGIQDWTPITGSTGETTSHVVTGLTNDVEHTFAVRAVNAGVAGPPGQASAEPKAAVSVPVQPRNFSAVQTGQGEVRLEWERSVQPLAVTGYHFIQDNISSEDDVPDWTPISDSDSNTVSHNITGLTAENTYTFAIRAVNSKGSSDSSNTSSVTIVERPLVPKGFTALAGDEQVQLSWSYPKGQTSITGFQYQQKTGGDFGDDWTDITESTAATKSHIVTGLANGTAYTFQVRAVNVTVGSEPSNTVTSIPVAAGSRPARPDNFLAEQTGVHQVELEWNTARKRLTVTGYQYTDDSGSNWRDISGSDSGTASHTVSGLNEETTYTFAVRAVNSKGSSASSNTWSVTIVAKPDRPSGLGVTAGDSQATVDWAVPSNKDGPPIDKYQLVQVPQSKLTADDRADNDEFGYSVAIDGDTLVVGAHLHDVDDNGTSIPNAGAAYVFAKVSGVWAQVAKLTASDGAANDEFGISVAVDGDTILVGAHQDDDNGDQSGSAYIFTKFGGLWGNAPDSGEHRVETAKLTASDAAASDEFGIAVAVDGDTAVIGARQDDTRNGSAYVFTKVSGVWSQKAKLIASDGAANDEFGYSVAVDGDTLVVGAHLHDVDDNGTSISNAGAVYVFVEPTDGWDSDADGIITETAKLTASDAAENDEFGISVAVHGDTVVVGAHQPYYLNDASEPVSRPGAAYVFTRDSNSGKWSQPVRLTASNGAASDEFGISVAVDGNTAVIGAYLDDRDDDIILDYGSAYVFARDSDTGVWSQTLNLAAPFPDAALSDQLGYSVVVDGGTLLAGAPQDDEDTSNSGSTYVMDILRVEWADLVPVELTLSDDGEYYDYRVLHLTNDQEYALRVRSVNVAGNNPSAETVAATPMHARPDKTEGLSARAGDQRVTLRWVDPRDSSIDSYQILQPPEQTKLTAGSDGERNGEFGESVAVGDGTAVVGAPEHDINGNADAGAAYVFTRNRNSGEWSDPIELTAGSDGAEDDWFGYSVAVDGDTVVVGAYQHDVDSKSNAGAAYVFTKVSGVWSGAVKLTASDAAENDEFGISVAVHGDTIVVGAYKDDDNGTQSGSAYVFTEVEGEWGNTPDSGEPHRIETAKLTVSGGAAFDYFGHSVAVDSETVVIGARGYKDTPGAAYVFVKPNNGWGDEAYDGNETAKLTASNAHDNDQFGHSVAVDGVTVVVGAQQDDGTKGSAYVFTKPTVGGWADNIETARLAASDRGVGDYFGNSVAVWGGTIVIGVYNADIDECDKLGECDDDPRSGAAYLFTKPANVDWANYPNEDHRTESGKLILPTGEGVEERNDEFGNSVALDGQSIVVGAPQDNVESDDDESGSVYVSDIPQWFLIPGSKATTTSHPFRGLMNGVEYTFQVRAVDGEVEGLASDIVWATPMRAPARGSSPPVVNSPPSFGSADNFALAVEENTPPGTLVGMPLTAMDPNGDTLTYSLLGADASFFGIDTGTGQLTVKAPLDYEAKSVYQVQVLVSDSRNASDLVNVTIDVTNVDEAGMVSVSLEQPEVGTAVAASLSDPDGSVSNVSWKWARSSDGSNWNDISGADSDAYTPVADDVGSYLRATASYTDGHGPGKSAHAVMKRQTAHAVMERQTGQRAPSFAGDVTLTVEENVVPGSLVGSAVTATDPDGDTLTYSLSGTDASSFVIDGSTGQITVGSGTTLDYESGLRRYTVTVSVYDGRDAYGNEDIAIDDFIEVIIDVTNVDEAGMVSVSLEQPEVGTAVAASLSDPDGSVSNVSWKWARSSDGSNWNDISGADSDAYTPVADDVGSYLRATASYTDGHGPGKSAHAVMKRQTAHAVMERQTGQRAPSFAGDVTLTVEENVVPGSLVGSAVTATDPDGDTLTYSLSGTDASSFVIDGSTGQITVGSGTTLDYESGLRRYTVTVSVYDGRDAYGNEDIAIDDFIEVIIDVTNVDEAGMVSVSLEQPEVGTAVAASLSDPDGSVSNVSWQWATSSDRADWHDTDVASSSTYTPVDLDADKYLRVTASYVDGEGYGKQAQAVLSNLVQGLPKPVATPTTTRTLTAPSPTPTAEPAPSEADGGDEGFPWWAIVVVVIGVVAGVVLLIVLRRSRR